MSTDFKNILQLREEIKEATHEIKARLVRMHKEKGIDQSVQIAQMGISDLIVYVNELERVAILCT